MSAPQRILILDDEVPLVEAWLRHFERRGYQPIGVYLVSEAVRAIEEAARDGSPFIAVITDLRLPDGDGRAIVRLVREKLPRCPVLMITGSRSVSGAVDAIRLGAVTVLEKPVSLEALEKEVRDAVASRADLEPHSWPGNGREMENVVEWLSEAAPAIPQMLPPEGLDLHAMLRNLEDRLIREALERSGGKKSQAAQSLGLNRTTLVEKLRKRSRGGR